jgi:hypothetical protein
VSLKGKIALAKYGGPFRGVKVQNAQANDMVGVIIFSDPGDDGPQVAKGQAAYPGILHLFQREYRRALLTEIRRPSPTAIFCPARICRVHQQVSG